MTRPLAAVPLVLSAVLLIAQTLPAGARAAAANGPSVLVQLAKLQRGSLPKVVTVFGKVQAGEAMRQNVTAPAAAVVEDVFVKPGQKVKAGAALIRLGPTPGAAAAYKKAASALKNAQGLVQRTKALLAQHLATRQQLADAHNKVSDAQASLAALAAEGASTPQTLFAANDGVVMSISANPGAIVNSGAALLTLVRTNGLVLRAGVVPEEAEQIHEGDRAQVSALGGGDAGVGAVLLRGSIVDPASGLVPIEVGLPNGVFLPGQAGEARIVTAHVEGYVVPHDAILVNDSGAPYVVQAKDMIAREVAVKILLDAGAKDVISGALDPHAALVLAGNYQLKDGMKVRVAAPNPSGGQ